MTNLLETLRALIGTNHVLTESDAAPYAVDWMRKYHGAPLAVVRPSSTEDVSAIVKACSENGTAIVPIGGNTGLTGATHTNGEIMISTERMTRIREVRVGSRIAVVESGAILSQIHDAVEAHDLIFPLTFGAKGSARIGGALSTNAGGSNVLRYGNTRAQCLGLEVVLANGDVLDLMTGLHKDNSGYDLKDLFIGAEGTLGVITAAVLKLHPKPQAYATAMAAVSDLPTALKLLNALQAATGGAVEAFEYMPGDYMQAHDAHFPDRPPCFSRVHDVNIMIEVATTSKAEGTPGADGEVPLMATLQSVLGDMMETGEIHDAVLAQNEAQRRAIWERREAAAEVQTTAGPLIDHDIAVPLDDVATFFGLAEDRLRKMVPDAQFLYVSHLGDGNIHFAVRTQAGPETYDAITECVEDIVLQLRGSFSAEHGIGLSKKNSMARRKDTVALATMRRIKSALDPKGLFNPGKVLPEP